MKTWKTDMFSLRCLLFCFFGGIGCLFPYLPLHMKSVGLTIYESHAVSIVAPLVAALGPLFVSPLADRLGGTRGRSMRILLSVFVFLSAVSYLLLLCVPVVQRSDGRQPAVSFSCDPKGAAVLQERCKETACYQWPERNIGPLLLTQCSYDCDSEHLPLSGEADITTNQVPVEDHDNEDNGNDDKIADDDVPLEVESLDPDSDQVTSDTDDGERKRRHVVPYSDDAPPHLCFKDDKDQMTCHVYTKDSGGISINASFLQAENDNYENWCIYPLAGNFSCRIPPKILETMGHVSCRVVCSLPNPYSSVDSVLAQSQCQRTGNEIVTFWSYLLVRSVADIFPTTAIGLLHATVVVATCEASFGQADVGREMAFGSLGFAVFSPIVGVLNTFVPLSGAPSYIFAFIGFAVLMLVSTVILLFSKSLPLNRPEWWSRHARVMPLGGLKRHLGELVCFIIILVTLGSLWSGIDSYLSWHLLELGRSEVLLGLTLTAGALPAIPFLWNSERIVDYCGHTNLLIIGFIFYIIRYAVYSYMEMAWWALANEALEVFTMSLLWVTVMLYMRQLMPRHLTVTAQGMAVLFHFCFGRCLGAVFTAVISSYATDGVAPLVRVYQMGAVVSAVVASVYFIVYYCCLKYCCQPIVNQRHQENSDVTPGSTSNGTYTPLRVYHNGNGQKEQQNY